jgi:hypothetical protein
MRHLSMLFLLVCALFGCEQNDGQLSKLNEVGWTDAKLLYQLPVDGCDWHLSMTQKDEVLQYVPNDATRKKLDDFIKKVEDQNSITGIAVKVKMKTTGAKKKVICGFNTSTQMEEVELLEIDLR